MASFLVLLPDVVKQHLEGFYLGIWWALISVCLTFMFVGHPKHGLRLLSAIGCVIAILFLILFAWVLGAQP